MTFTLTSNDIADGGVLLEAHPVDEFPGADPTLAMPLALSAALRDGDHIEYIIRETGINQDGKTPGITMRKCHLSPFRPTGC